MRQPAVRQAEELACVVLPQEDLSLLVPNDCVAEILPWRRVKPLPGMPRWCLGTLVWRGQAVVVIDFQLLTQDSGQSRLNRRALVVMHRTTSREGMSFYAIASSGRSPVTPDDGYRGSDCAESALSGRPGQRRHLNI